MGKALTEYRRRAKECQRKADLARNLDMRDHWRAASKAWLYLVKWAAEVEYDAEDLGTT
jgi:hypothetical protein